MEKYPKEIKLKNGQKAMLRLFKEEDMDWLISFFQTLPEEDRLYLRSDVIKKENIIKRFGNLNYDYMFPLIAYIGNKIVAQGNLSRAEYGWTKNLGEIRIVVARDYQSMGLCTILTRELFLQALTTDLYKIQADLMENQVSAIAAFERMGFKKEAVLRKHVTDIEGNRHNLVIMSLDIQELWYLMEDFIKDRFYVT